MNLLPEPLEIARAIGYESYRARALQRLVPHLPEIVPEALEVVRAMRDEFNRARALQGLAPHLSENLLSEALEVVRAIGSESYRAEALQGLAPHLSENLLPEALEIARAIGSESSRAEALQRLVTKLASISIDLLFLKKTFHALATLNRSHFLENLPQLAPLIVKFGGIEALREIPKAIMDVSRWWK